MKLFAEQLTRTFEVLVIFRWDGILSGRFTGLRGANDLRAIPYIKPIKVYSKEIRELFRVNFFTVFHLWWYPHDNEWLCTLAFA